MFSRTNPLMIVGCGIDKMPDDLFRAPLSCRWRSTCAVFAVYGVKVRQTLGKRIAQAVAEFLWIKLRDFVGLAVGHGKVYILDRRWNGRKSLVAMCPGFLSSLTPFPSRSCIHCVSCLFSARAVPPAWPEGKAVDCQHGARTDRNAQNFTQTKAL